jgi:hypothetical protein
MFNSIDEDQNGFLSKAEMANLIKKTFSKKQRETIKIEEKDIEM